MTRRVRVYALLALLLLSPQHQPSSLLAAAQGADIDSAPTEHQAYIAEQYQKFMQERKEKRRRKDEEERLRQYEEYLKQHGGKPPPQPAVLPSPSELGQRRDPSSPVPLTPQADIPAGTYWFGTQMTVANKLVPATIKDGAEPRVRASVRAFAMDVAAVSNAQFADFVRATGYKTESEVYGWSFVLDSLASEDTIEEVDGPEGHGRVKDAKHWLAVKGADWAHPHGPESSVLPPASASAAAAGAGAATAGAASGSAGAGGSGSGGSGGGGDGSDLPVVQVSWKDASEYCAWASGPEGSGPVRRLPSEREWEFAARGGRVNETYPWGHAYRPRSMNVWEGDFPSENLVLDGYHGVAPVRAFAPNAYGLYNMVGNVWEWVQGGSPDKRVLRGGSFVDSLEGQFNHAAMVSTKQVNAGDSGGSNVGFRCASSRERVKGRGRGKGKGKGKGKGEGEADRIEL